MPDNTKPPETVDDYLKRFKPDPALTEKLDKITPEWWLSMVKPGVWLEEELNIEKP